MIKKRIFGVFTLIMILVISGCATLPNLLKDPSVALESVSLANNNLLSPRFKLVLRVTNPNSIALPVKGMSYTINIQGVELFSGATNDIPQIAAYGDTVLTLELGTNIIKAGNLLRLLLDKSTNTISYNIGAQIDLSGIPTHFNINEAGVINLADQSYF